MRKFWLVCKHEYLRHVLRKRFIMAVLSVPVFIVFILGVSILAAVMSSDSRPVGYVDQSGLFADAQSVPQARRSLFPSTRQIAYPSEESARTALEERKIQGVFIISADYWQTGRVTLVSETPLESSVINDFRKFLVYNLLSAEQDTIRERLVSGPEIVVRTLDVNREMDSSNPLTFIIPIFSGVLFMIAINTSGGYLMQAVVEEKENRTMEIILTSVSTDQFMAGKILGNLSVGLTQLIIWLLTALAGLILAINTFPEIANFKVDSSFVVVMIATFLPAFVMIAALMAMVGATTTEAREAQQISALFTIPIVAPFWFISGIIMNPNSPLAIGFSLFPLTAPITLPIRVLLTNLPVWQIALSIALLVLFALGAIWLASRAFRLGLLRYGKSTTLREIFQKA